MNCKINLIISLNEKITKNILIYCSNSQKVCSVSCQPFFFIEKLCFITSFSSKIVEILQTLCNSLSMTNLFPINSLKIK